MRAAWEHAAELVAQLVRFDTVVWCLLVLTYIFFVSKRPSWKTKIVEDAFKRSEDIPGPLSLPVFGTSWVFSFGGHSFAKIHEYYSWLRESYGPIVREEALMNVPVISVFERGDIEKVLKSAGKYPLRPPTEAIAHYRRSRPDRYASTGIVNEQGESWQRLRAALTPELTSPKTISAFAPQVAAVADDWCHLLRRLRSPACVIDQIDLVAGRLGLEATCALVLGRRMGFLLAEKEPETATRLAAAVHRHFVACRDTYFGLAMWKIISTPTYRRLATSEEEIYELATELIRSADEATGESAIFQSVLKAKLDDHEKTAAIVDFIAAGIHTLRNSLIFLLYQVAKDPRVQEKILEDPTGAYAKACVQETFRVCPTVATLARINEEDLVLSGFRVKAGSVIVVHHGIACKNEKNFKDADKFIPERWLGENKLETTRNATYLVIPFGYGRRICPGKRFIEQVLPAVLERTVKNFIIEVTQPLELQFEFLLAPKSPVPMVFKERF